MKILFVCWANVSRSQMAAAYYNHITGTNDADAAGTEVEMPGETLGDRRARKGGTRVINTMRDEGIDLSSNVQTQLVEEMLDRYDQVISMANHAHTPEWLRNHRRFIYWEVKDPGGQGAEAATAARDSIKARVQALIRETMAEK